MVVSDTQHLDAMGLESLFGVFQLKHRVHAKSNVVDPQRGVGRRKCRGVVSEVKKSDERSVLKSKEKMRVGAIFTRRWHVIALDDVIKGQSQNVFVKVPGFLRILGSIGIVMQLLHTRRWRQCAGVKICDGHR